MSGVGLFGGTFDPVHKGHLSIARSFLDSPEIDQLWVLLTPYPPHKEREGYVDYNTRLEMLEHSFQNFRNLQILTIENELPKPSYTYNTICHLKGLYPDKSFYFCIGEDNLSQFHSWKFHKEILKEAELLVANRPGSDHTGVDQYILDKTTFVAHEPLEFSSSMVRERIRTGASISDIVTEDVEEIILKKGLYR